MAAKKDIISDSLGIEPLEQTTKITQVLPAIKAQKNDDYEYARQNLYDIIEIIKTMAEANKDLLNLAKVKKDLDKEDVPEQKNITNNNLVLTSADLLKMIKDKSNE